MTLFEIPLEPRIRDTEKLYYRREKGSVSFNTFYGAISIEKVKKFTNISSIGFRIEAEQNFRAEVRTEEGTISIGNFFESGTITVDLSDVPDTSKLLYPVVDTDKIKKITVLAECEELRHVNCALITCTYRREEQIKKNISYLSGRIDCEMIIVDNARTLSQGDFPNNVTLIANINNGGSGGYKKGMEVACEMGKFTHFLLMDDDVEVDYTSVQRAVNFLKCLKSEYKNLSISGSMLYMDKPTRQFEAGGYFNEEGLQRGFGFFFDLTDEKKLIENQRLNDMNYGGWWYMLMPAEYAKQGYFPLPFFLKYDDVEYALRCEQQIITLNGVGIWHEKFESKYNSATEYYNTRNYLHLCSLHCRNFTYEKALRFVRKQMKAKQKRQQYKMAQAVKMGYEDYMKGIDYLQELDAEQKHREICRLNYRYISYDEIEKRYGVRPRDDKYYPCPGKKRLLFVMLPRKFVFTDHFHDRPAQYMLAKYAVHCDSDNNQGYVTWRKNKHDIGREL